MTGNISSNRRRRYVRSPAGKKETPLIFFCGDPHGSFDHINEAVKKWHPKAIVLLGDMQPYAPMDVVLKDAMELTEVWWIPGNHDSDSEEYYERLWKGPLAEHNLHGRVANVAGIRIAGLGGVSAGRSGCLRVIPITGRPQASCAAPGTARSGTGDFRDATERQSSRRFTTTSCVREPTSL